tara:strand:+ start:223 stop:663 length:441 start_codon:yes stop_codon:yes gene_type:complete
MKSTLEEIKTAICDSLHLSETQFMSSSRKREYVDAKTMYCKIASELTSESSTFIGKSINRDHATVLHHRKKHETLYTYDRDYRHKYMLILNLLPVRLSEIKSYKCLIDVMMERNKYLSDRYLDVVEKLNVEKKQKKELYAQLACYE